MESTDSSTGGGAGGGGGGGGAACSKQPNLPPGFRFHPTDEELVVHYLKRKASSAPLPVAIIAEVDLYKFDPWELPGKATFGEQEWYFFSPRDRKYPNGARPNRAATSGYWKATGTDKPVLTSGGTQKVGVKKALVFYGGKPPKGIKTNWIMHEYRLAENKANNRPPGYDLGNKKNSLRLDDWVLCRIYKKSNHRPVDHDKEDSIDDMLGSIPPSISIGHGKLHFPMKGSNYGSLLEPEHNLFENMLASSDGFNTSSMSQQLASSTASKLEFPFVPLKRTIQSLYWPEPEDQEPAATSTKKFHRDCSGGGGGVDDSSIDRADYHNNTSIASLLSQLHQNPPPLQSQAVLGSVGDGVFRPPYQLPAGLNWYA